MRMLRAPCEWAGNRRRAAKQRDELAPFIKKMHPKTPVELIIWI